MKKYRVIPAPRQYYVIWFLRSKDEKPGSHEGWPTLNEQSKYTTKARALKALSAHRVTWPDEIVSLRCMTAREWKIARNR